MRAPQQLNEILTNVKSNGELFEVAEYLKQVVNRIEKSILEGNLVFSERDQNALVKIVNTIKEINGYTKKELSIDNQNVANINRHKIAYSLMKLENNFRYLTEGVRK